MKHHTFKNRLHQGQASVEAVMSVLLFTAMLGTLLSLSLYMYVNHTLLTAAKEGARTASLDTNLASGTTYSTGVADVRTRVNAFLAQSSSITLPSSGITVSGPTGTVGSRTVSVQLSYTFPNPVQIRTFMNRLSGGHANGLDSFNINSTASMHYEE